MEEKNIAFARHWLPTLEAGKYTMEVEQTATNISGFEKDRATGRLFVGGERFRLGPESIYSAYPAPNALGEFRNTFPHLVLHDPTLPWQRRLPRSSNESLPWLWLMLTDETEPVEVRETTIEEALIKTANIFVPALSLNENEDAGASCTVVEVQTALFKAIAPPREDLPFTSHVRIVNLDDKVTDPTVNGEAFSCLLANRFTREPSADPAENYTEGLRHTAFVVSLEGFEAFLYGEADIAQVKVRMFCLHRWSFSVARSPFDFKTVLETTDVGVLKKSVDEKTVGAKVAAIMNLGLVPMNHSLRDGSRTVSWYRGPLCPTEPRPAESYTGESPSCAFLPDEKLRYDPELGMFDTSYSAAWQTGRLLALQNLDIANGLMRWRLENKVTAAACLNDLTLMKHMPESDSSPAAALFKQFLENNSGHDADDVGFRGSKYEKPLAEIAKRLNNARFRMSMSMSQSDLLRMWKEAADEELD